MNNTTALRRRHSETRLKIHKAIHDESVVARVTYEDADGDVTTRVISPIRFAGGWKSDRVVALCLGREEPRQFHIANIQEIELVPASDVLMPEPIVTRKDSHD